MQLNPYVHFNGNCEEAFKFYEKHLGATSVALFRFDEAPGGPPVPEGWNKKVMHGRLEIAGQVLMGMDAPPERYHKPQGFSLSLQGNDVAEAERTFKALAEGGQTIMPIQETFWAARFGMLVDRFGIPWMVNCEKPAPAQ